MKTKRSKSSLLARRTVAIAALAASVPGSLSMVSPQLNGRLIADQRIEPSSRQPFYGPAPAPSPIERVGPDQVRIGGILVDTARKELSVRGVVNDVPILEFLANTKGGWKAYESALELESNAVNFNLACLLIGLDPAGATIARYQFDPQPPQGQPVELFVEWDESGKRRRVRAEELIYNADSKQTLPEGPFVYTGSAFREGNTYMAEMEGVLVGFMHTPAPIIESPRPFIGTYGANIINPNLNLKPGTSVALILRALPKTPTRK